jgi:hypothetical protein
MGKTMLKKMAASLGGGSKRGMPYSNDQSTCSKRSRSSSEMLVQLVQEESHNDVDEDDDSLVNCTKQLEQLDLDATTLNRALAIVRDDSDHRAGLSELADNTVLAKKYVIKNMLKKCHVKLR